jgi:hypothetical protein
MAGGFVAKDQRRVVGERHPANPRRARVRLPSNASLGEFEEQQQDDTGKPHEQQLGEAKRRGLQDPLE